MNCERAKKLATDLAIASQIRNLTTREHAEHFVTQAVDEMIEQEEAFHLSDDEVRMIKAHRAFLSRSKPGAVFQWRTKNPPTLVVPTEPVLIRDLEDVSA